MPKKLTYEYVKNFINNENLLISTTYNNNKELLIIKCNKCNEHFNQSFSSYNQGHRCQKCANRMNGIASSEKRYGNRIKLKETLRICEMCKKKFTPKRKESRFCNKICSNLLLISDKEKLKENGRKGGLISSKTSPNRSKAEIYFSELCMEYFTKPAITCNEQFFIDKNGGKWDADMIIHHLKIAILYNGIWHYKEVCKNQKFERTVSRDRLKEKIILDNGYTYYIVKDIGKFNKEFVQEQFNLFIHKLHFKNTIEALNTNILF